MSEIFSARNLLKALRRPGQPPEVRGQEAVPERRSVDPLLPAVLESPEEEAAPVGPAAAAVAPWSYVGEEFRLLRAKVRALGEQRPFRCIGLVSAAGGEGKTTVALGLASALAQEPGCRVLLVEADLRKPSVETYLGMPPAAGLADWLQVTDVPLSVRRLSLGFRVVPAGTVRLERPELLGTPRMAGMMQFLRQRYDYVVLDCPPLAPVADSVILQDLVDGFLLVVRSRHCPRETILKAVSNLKPDRILGVVFNDHRDLLTSYYTYGYQQYRA